MYLLYLNTSEIIISYEKLTSISYNCLNFSKNFRNFLQISIQYHSMFTHKIFVHLLESFTKISRLSTISSNFSQTSNLPHTNLGVSLTSKMGKKFKSKRVKNISLQEVINLCLLLPNSLNYGCCKFLPLYSVYTSI